MRHDARTGDWTFRPIYKVNENIEDADTRVYSHELRVMPAVDR